MVNSQVVAETVNALKLDINVDKIPNATPVVEVGVKQVKEGFSRNSSATTSGSVTINAATLGTTSCDWYMTSATISLVKDAACDVATSVLNLTAILAETGTLAQIVGLPVITLTAQTMTVTLLFSHPIKILRNTSVALSGTFTVGVMVRVLSVSGFRDEVN